MATSRLPRGTANRYFEEVVLAYEGDDCLTWPFTRQPSGYGKLFRDGKHHRVTRLVCAAIFGPPPSQQHEAAHSCGNGHLGCVAKRHLSWKTPKENSADKIVHGTVNGGTRNGRAKLTDEDVRNITALKGALSIRQIAERFGVSHATVGSIHNGKTWATLGLPT